MIPGDRSEHYRTELIGALSDLFFHLRFPVLPDRFRESVCNWIVELSAVLLKAITFNDQAFLLAQILRCHKPLDWAVPLVQTFINVPSLDPTIAVNSFMALLKTLLEPILRREDFLGRIKTFYEGDNEWALVDDDGNAVSSPAFLLLSFIDRSGQPEDHGHGRARSDRHLESIRLPRPLLRRHSEVHGLLPWVFSFRLFIPLIGLVQKQTNEGSSCRCSDSRSCCCAFRTRA